MYISYINLSVLKAILSHLESNREECTQDNHNSNIISSNKTQVTLFHNKMAYPVYMTIGNLIVWSPSGWHIVSENYIFIKKGWSVCVRDEKIEAVVIWLRESHNVMWGRECVGDEKLLRIGMRNLEWDWDWEWVEICDFGNIGCFVPLCRVVFGINLVVHRTTNFSFVQEIATDMVFERVAIITSSDCNL